MTPRSLHRRRWRRPARRRCRQPQPVRHARHRRERSRTATPPTVDRAVAGRARRVPGLVRRPRPKCAPTCSTRSARPIMARADELGDLLSREEGKTLPEGKGEVMRAARIFKYFAGEALRRHGQYARIDAPRHRRRDLPRGGRRVRPDHAVEFPDRDSGMEGGAGAGVRQHRGHEAGQSLTPAIAHALAAIIHEARRPDGRVQPDARRRRRRRARSSTIPTSTASRSPARRAVGAQVGARRHGAPGARAARDGRQESAGRARRLPISTARSRCALDGAFFATGQRCTASSRIIVTEGIHDRFVEALAARAACAQGRATRSIRRRRSARRRATAQLEQNLRYVDIATERRRPARDRRRGARARDTRLLHGARGDRGHRARHAHQHARKCSARSRRTVRVKDYERGARRSRTRASSACRPASSRTRSSTRATSARNVRAGMVMVNLPTAGVDYHVPFGGTRKSSYGPREQGFAAVEFYTQIKTSLRRRLSRHRALRAKRS